LMPLDLLEIRNCCPSGENIEYHLPDLKQLASCRFVIEGARRLERIAQNEPESSESLKDGLNSLVDFLRGSIPNGLPPLVDAATLCSKAPLVPPELVYGLLHKGSKLVLGGSSKSFKTWALADLALSVSHGEPWLGFKTTKAPALYLNLEIQDWDF